MLKLNTKDYEKYLKRIWDTRSACMVYGAPGIGKSDIPRQVFPSIAKNMDREFVEWDSMTTEQRAEAISSPEKYWIFCDQRIGQMDTTDLRGIPKLSGEWLETCPLSWIIYFTQPKAAGLIFFDEINLAPPTVAGQAYQIIQQRSISDRRLSNDVVVVAAGNRSEDRAFTFDMPMPLRDRFNEIEITYDVDAWTEWAAKNKINSHLVAFINWRPTYLFTLDKVKDTGNKGSSPRAVERAHKLLKDEDITSDFAHSLISSACGLPFATEFQAYVKHVKELDWDALFNTPSIVADFSIDMLWATAGGVVEKWQRDNYSEDTFDKICDIVSNMRKDFAIVTLRLVRDGDAKQFRKCIKGNKKFATLAQKYVKYLSDGVIAQ